MISESKQMLTIPLVQQGLLDAKIDYVNHPSSIWARQSKENFEWLLLHAMALAEEYQYRYKRQHDSLKGIDWIANNYHKLSFDKKGLLPFARCFGEFKTQLDLTIPDPVLAYREFYRLDKVGFARWPDQESIPDWWFDKSEKWVDKNFKNGQYIKR